MLVFTRKRGEAIVIGDNIEVVVLSAGKEGLRVGVRAPLSIPVHRKEIYELIKEENRTAALGLGGAAQPRVSADTSAGGRR
jgi:carbon storage regulator